MLPPSLMTFLFWQPCASLACTFASRRAESFYWGGKSNNLCNYCKITRKSGHRCASLTCITWINCITCITWTTCTTEISHQITLWDIIDFNWLSLIINNYHWSSLIIIDHHWLSLIIIDYHWLSLIILDYVWKSEKRWMTDLMTTWNQEMLAHLEI